MSRFGQRQKHRQGLDVFADVSILKPSLDLGKQVHQPVYDLLAAYFLGAKTKECPHRKPASGLRSWGQAERFGPPKSLSSELCEFRQSCVARPDELPFFDEFRWVSSEIDDETRL
jgi:hypothetical protein